MNLVVAADRSSDRRVFGSVHQARRVADSLKFDHANTELFSLWFQGRVAAGMRSYKPNNRIACASGVEQRGRVLHGSDRSEKSALAPNCRLAQAM